MGNRWRGPGKSDPEPIAEIDGMKPPGAKPLAMFVPLQETVNAGLVNAAGWAVGLGGIALTALWLRDLYS
jgi:hypothetical protein